MPGLDAQTLATLPLWLVAFLLSTTCHEAAHALAAKKGGDLTAYEGGQVSLDPLPHLKREPFGMIVVPILSFLLNGGTFMIGWASAPYDRRWADRFPRRAALMALAGPAANLALALIAAGLIHAGIAADAFDSPGRASFSRVVETATGDANALTMFLSVLFSLNVLLFSFNLLPVPPLDGNGVVPLFLPARLAERWQRLWSDRGAAFVGLLVAWIVFGKVYPFVFRLELMALYPTVGYG